MLENSDSESEDSDSDSNPKRFLTKANIALVVVVVENYGDGSLLTNPGNLGRKSCWRMCGRMWDRFVGGLEGWIVMDEVSDGLK